MQFNPSSSYEMLLKQARALNNLNNTLEKRISVQNKVIEDLQRKLALVDEKEINELKDLVEILTNENEELRAKISNKL